MRKIRRFAPAKISLRNAEVSGLNKEILLINECKILKESGELNKALLLLEPIEQNILALENIILDRKKHEKNDKNNSKTKNRDSEFRYPAGLETLRKRNFLAERLFLATQCMAESKLKNSKSIVARYVIAGIASVSPSLSLFVSVIAAVVVVTPIIPCNHSYC